MFAYTTNVAEPAVVGGKASCLQGPLHGRGGRGEESPQSVEARPAKQNWWFEKDFHLFRLTKTGVAW